MCQMYRPPVGGGHSGSTYIMYCYTMLDISGPEARRPDQDFVSSS